MPQITPFARAALIEFLLLFLFTGANEQIASPRHSAAGPARARRADGAPRAGPTGGTIGGGSLLGARVERDEPPPGSPRGRGAPRPLGCPPRRGGPGLSPARPR